MRVDLCSNVGFETGYPDNPNTLTRLCQTNGEIKHEAMLGPFQQEHRTNRR